MRSLVWGTMAITGSRGRAPGQAVKGRSPLQLVTFFYAQSSFLRSSSGILQWCDGCTVHQICKFGPKNHCYDTVLYDTVLHIVLSYLLMCLFVTACTVVQAVV